MNINLVDEALGGRNLHSHLNGSSMCGWLDLKKIFLQSQTYSKLKEKRIILDKKKTKSFDLKIDDDFRPIINEF